MTTRERILAVIAGAVALSVGYYLLALGPLVSKSKDVNRSVRKLLSQGEKLDRAKLRGADLERELARLKAQVDHDPERSPFGHQNRMIRAISSACDECAALLASAVPLDVEEKGDLVRHPVQVQVKGDLAAVISFLASLERTHPIMEIGRLNMEYDEKTDALDMQMLVVSYTPM